MGTDLIFVIFLRCYESLISGCFDDGLTDLTGYVAEKWMLHDKRGKFPHKSIKDAEEFWARLQKFTKNKSLMGCSITGGTG
jgi:hypothetical protein